MSVSEEHYGDWNCQLEDFFDSTQGVVSLTRPGVTFILFVSALKFSYS